MNEYLNQYKGKTSSEKLLFDAKEYLIEEKFKKSTKSPMEVCMIHVENPLTKEITGIGGSIPNDLIMNNLGFWLASHFRNSNNVTTNILGLIDTGSVARSLLLVTSVPSTSQYNNTLTGVGGSTTQIGSGSTAPTRFDDNIEVAFGTAPESGLLANSLNVLDVPNGRFDILSSVLAGGSGTIREAGMIMFFAEGATDRQFLFSRDLISPNVPFVVAQTINITWTWQM